MKAHAGLVVFLLWVCVSLAQIPEDATNCDSFSIKLVLHRTDGIEVASPDQQENLRQQQVEAKSKMDQFDDQQAIMLAKFDELQQQQVQMESKVDKLTVQQETVLAMLVELRQQQVQTESKLDKLVEQQETMLRQQQVETESEYSEFTTLYAEPQKETTPKLNSLTENMKILMQERLAKMPNTSDAVIDQQSQNTTRLINTENDLTIPITPLNHILSCGELPITFPSGVYTIQPPNSPPFPVYCDQEYDDGGWTVIQKRSDWELKFNRMWNEYRDGFGEPSGGYWLGLEKIFRITNLGQYELAILIQSQGGSKIKARYDHFEISSEQDSYRLVNLGKHRGYDEDALSYHNEMKFSTRDRDNDQWDEGNCAERTRGGWWHKSCAHSALNGDSYMFWMITYHGSSSIMMIRENPLPQRTVEN